jgi:hypothetical protein
MGIFDESGIIFRGHNWRPPGAVYIGLIEAGPYHGSPKT